MLLNTIIIDDEPLARKGLKEYIDDIEFLHLSGEFDNPLKALTVLDQEEVQLILLDIQMPKLSGLDFLKSLVHPPMVILTTAYPEYALEGFELDVLDYLVKPVSFNRFLKAVMKAKEYYDARKNMASHDQIVRETNDDFIFIKADNKIVKIFYDDILFAEALQNYVAIHTAEKKYITYLTFKSAEESLPAEKFLKVHKSFIVQVAKVKSIEGNIIHIGNMEIPISRNMKDEVMQKLLADKFLKR